MADIGTSVRSVLASASAVAAMVRSRIYPDVLPQYRPGDAATHLPAIRYQLIGGASVHHMTDASGLARATVQIDCYAPTRVMANALEDAVRLALDRHAGTSESVAIRSVLGGERRQDYEQPADASDVGAYVAGRTYEVWHRETV